MGRPVLASTEEKALLRYLFLRERYLNEENQQLEEALEEMVGFDRSHGYVYGFTSYCNAYEIWGALSVLDELVLARYVPESGHIALTVIGRGFGTQLHFVEELEQDIKATFEGWSRGRVETSNDQP